MGIKILPKLKEFKKTLFTKEKLPLILLFGILIAIISVPIKKVDNSAKEKTDTNTYEENKEDYISELEKRLKRILENTQDVGKADVMITVKNNGKEILYSQMNKSSSKTTENRGDGSNYTKEDIDEQESVLYTKEEGTEKPYVQEEEMPEIQGVVIIAQGAGNAKVTTEITEAASTLLGIPVNKIKVLKMEV